MKKDELDIKTDNQVLSSPNAPYTLSLRRTDFSDEKEMEKFVKSCEKIIRMSPEYRIWTDYIRSVLGFHRCEITGEMHQETSVDIHHHPYSLYAITKAVILRSEASGKEFCSYDISSEVIQLHYDMRVPFCLLVSSLHEKYHNGALQIPMDLVHGDIQYFIDNYLTFLDDDAVLDKSYLKKVEKFFNEHKEIDIVGGIQLTPLNEKGFAGLSYITSSLVSCITQDSGKSFLNCGT